MSAKPQSPSRVLQVSVRLSEGGAAGVARMLADELRVRGIESPFAYGYGNRGLASPLEDQYQGIRVTPLPIAGINRVSYRWAGKETELRSPRRWAELEEAIAASDVVHLHVIHTYFLSTDKLIDTLITAGKPVVWTLHDQWTMTGRCAQPGTCRLWTEGCPTCPHLEAYPPAKLDHAGRRHPERRAAIRRLQDAVPTSIVACAEWLADEARIAGFRHVTTVRNSVDREFWKAAAVRSRDEADTIRLLFVCRDLRDPGKVDPALLSRIAREPGVSLTVVGDDAPPLDPAVTLLPATASRAELAAEMTRHDALVFTSGVDYYPLTVAEALAAGLGVLALDSPAAREFSDFEQVRICAGADELVQAARTPWPAFSAEAARAYFSPDRMAAEYLDVYSSVLA